MRRRYRRQDFTRSRQYRNILTEKSTVATRSFWDHNSSAQVSEAGLQVTSGSVHTNAIQDESTENTLASGQPRPNLFRYQDKTYHMAQKSSLFLPRCFFASAQVSNEIVQNAENVPQMQCDYQIKRLHNFEIIFM